MVITAVVGIGRYILEAPKREKLAHYQAWQMINSATGQKTSGGRIEALQDLVKDGVWLSGLDVSGAELYGINLENAVLIRADLSKANLNAANLTNAGLFFAKLHYANLYRANLRDANLPKADLTSASLYKADLRDADLSGANLDDASLYDTIIGCIVYCTNFKGAKGITPEQIKEAKYWQSACYNPDFRKQLGLPPQNPKCAGDEPKK